MNSFNSPIVPLTNSGTLPRIYHPRFSLMQTYLPVSELIQLQNPIPEFLEVAFDMLFRRLIVGTVVRLIVRTV